MHDYRYIPKSDPNVQKAYKEAMEIIHEVQREIESKFTFMPYVVGSYKRNMITFDAKSNKGYDFDFNLQVNDTGNLKPKQIKDLLRSAIGNAAVAYGYRPANDSTRVITIRQVDTKRSKLLHSCDFAITRQYEDEDFIYEDFIYYDKKRNSYYWRKQRESLWWLPEKIEFLKDLDEDVWKETRELYIRNKNKNEDPDIHSRDILARTVHTMCQRYGYYNKE